jgi:hypothetical protein
VADHDDNDPLVWLLLLERGRRTGDFELAARAQRELARLGIRVIYGKRRGGSDRRQARRGDPAEAAR